MIPVAIRLMTVAEQLFDDVPDSGEQKKAYVMEAIKAMVEGVSGFTGSPELWAKIELAMSLMIDAACIFLFPKKKEE
jgi:hypothetical protein